MFNILAHTTWVLAREWALFIRAAKTVNMGAYLGVGACPGHYSNTENNKFQNRTKINFNV